MNTRHEVVRRCTVYHGPGEPLSETCEMPVPPDDAPVAERAGGAGLRAIMSNVVVCARGDLDVAAAVRLMMKHHIGCLPIVDRRRRPVGIITKFDVVELLDEAQAPHPGRRAHASAPDLRVRTAEEVMMPLTFTLAETSSVAHAAALMAAEDTHHVLVIGADGGLVGVVSSRDIVMWLAERERAPRAPSG